MLSGSIGCRTTQPGDEREDAFIRGTKAGALTAIEDVPGPDGACVALVAKDPGVKVGVSGLSLAKVGSNSFCSP